MKLYIPLDIFDGSIAITNWVRQSRMIPLPIYLVIELLLLNQSIIIIYQTAYRKRGRPESSDGNKGLESCSKMEHNGAAIR